MMICDLSWPAINVLGIRPPCNSQELNEQNCKVFCYRPINGFETMSYCIGENVISHYNIRFCLDL